MLQNKTVFFREKSSSPSDCHRAADVAKPCSTGNLPTCEMYEESTAARHLRKDSIVRIVQGIVLELSITSSVFGMPLPRSIAVSMDLTWDPAVCA